MRPGELLFIKDYAHRLNDSGGDLLELTQAERRHLAMLLRKFMLEQELDKQATRLSQGTLPGMEVT